MTTIIIVITAIGIVAGLISKMSKKSSFGKKGSSGSPRSEANEPKLRKPQPSKKFDRIDGKSNQDVS